MLDASISEPENFDFWFRSIFAPYVVHFCASLTCILVFVWTLHFLKPTSFHGTEIFNFHPLFQTVAFVLVIPESILVMRFAGFSRTTTKPTHMFLHTVALAIAIFGTVAAIVYKERKDAPHFHTLHSWIGLGGMILLLGQWVLGAYAFYRAPGRQRAKIRPVHLHLGHFIVFLGGATMVTGLTEKMTSVGACAREITNECVVINSAGILTLITYAALGLALTAERQSSGRGLDSVPLLDEETITVTNGVTRE